MKRLLALTLTLFMLISTMTACSLIQKITDIDRNEITGPVEWDDSLGIPSWDSFDLAVVDSIDKLNYYSALYVLGNPTSYGKSASDLGTRILTLVAYDTDDKPDSDSSYGYEQDTDIPSDTTESQDPSDNNDGSNQTGSFEGIYYYSLSPNDVFSFDKVSMFQIELTDPDGFLASKLGLGTVDVVISENCIWDDSLITFRNGNRFFSCLSNGCGYDQQTGNNVWEFSTHKFISGFYIVKNIEQENYKFNVEIDPKGQATSFTCTEFKAGGPRADRNVKIASSTVYSTDGGSFTATELDQYFKPMKPSEDEHTPDTPSSSDTQVYPNNA